MLVMTAKEPSKKLLPSQETRLREWLAQNWKRDPVSAAILLLAWDEGLSSEEISALHWESVDLSAGLLEFRERRIPLESMLEDILNELIGDSIYVIPNGRSHYMPMNRMSHWQIFGMISCFGSWSAFPWIRWLKYLDMIYGLYRSLSAGMGSVRPD